MAAFAVFMSRIASNHVPTFTEMELTMAQAKAVYLIAARGSILMSDLAARLGVSTSTATGLVDRLVELKLLVRAADPDDRRHVLISSTATAHSHLERMRELNQQQLRDLLSLIGDDDLHVIERSIEILSEAAANFAPQSARSDATTREEAP